MFTGLHMSGHCSDHVAMHKLNNHFVCSGSSAIAAPARGPGVNAVIASPQRGPHSVRAPSLKCSQWDAHTYSVLTLRGSLGSLERVIFGCCVFFSAVLCFGSLFVVFGVFVRGKKLTNSSLYNFKNRSLFVLNKSLKHIETSETIWKVCIFKVCKT